MAISKIIKGFGLAGFLLLAPIASKRIETNARRYDVDPRISAYVDSILVPTMKAQEDSLGIRHFGKPEVFLNASGKNRGWYYPLIDSLSIEVPYSYKKFNRNLTRKVLHHELGHYYSDELSESLGNGSWPAPIGEEFEIGQKILSEGIAEYFERTFFPEDDSKDLSWDRSPEEIDEQGYFYYGILGYWLVKPIIEKYGEGGIEYIITHPIQEEDFKYLPKYSERALEELSKK